MHFLFSVDSYNTNVSANGVCVKKIASSLVSAGHNVTIICQRKDSNEKAHEKIDGLSIYRVPFEYNIAQNRNCFLTKFISKIKTFFHLPFFPINSRRYVSHIYALACNINAINKIDTFVAVTQLTDHIKAGILFKQKFPQTKLFIYSLDALTSGYVQNLKHFRNFYISRMRKYEIHALKKTDYFFAMNSHKKYIERNSFYNKYSDKIIYTDIPLFDSRKRTQAEANNGTILYSGNMSYLDIDFVKRIVDSLRNNFFTFVGPNNISLREKMNGVKNIEILNSVAHDQVISLQDKSEYLLAFDTLSSSMIPGKIFEYFTTNKTIIYCSVNKECPFIDYLNKYGNYILVKIGDTTEDIQKKLLEKHQCNPNFEKLLFENTPEYTANLFVSYSKFK